jgi:nitrite reductase (NADH) small subunit
MPLVEVGRASALPPDSVTEVAVGDRLFAVCNVGGKLYALDGVCPHTGGPLGQGNVQDGRLICPYHMWEFDCATGELHRDPSCRLESFPVEVEDGRIFLQAP